MSENSVRRLDFSKLTGRTKIVTSKTALKEVTPIKWSEDVLSGRKKVTISSPVK